MKIFCIGFNKTGTTSLNSLFSSLGFSTCHAMYSEWNLDDPRFDQFQCFSDGEKHDFAGIDKKFPGSKFILTSRSLDDWLVSRVRHIEIRKSVGKTGWMRQQYESDPQSAITSWIQNRKPYHKLVYNYFADRPDDLLSLNICNPRSHKVELARLLEFLDIKSEDMREFPHQRKTASITANMNFGIKALLLRKYIPRNEESIRAEVNGVLNDLGIPILNWSDDDLEYSETNTLNTDDSGSIVNILNKKPKSIHIE